ncbi:SGNH/GDSL hydrolase family protein [Gordonia sp. NPDC003376]
MISGNRSAPTSAATTTAPAGTTSASTPGTPATVEFMDSAKANPAEPRTIVLLGDSTGASTTGWAPALGRAISTTLQRPVATAYWNTETNGYGKPVPLGTGPNGPIGFWNGSATGVDAAYAREHLDAMIGKDVTPSIILLDFGLTEDTTKPLAPQIQPLITDLQKKYPQAAIAAIKQNPRRDGSDAEQMSGFAAAMDAEGVQVIDVYSAFPTDPAARAQLMSDDVNPNAAGQELWTKAVLAAFGLTPA